jgi:1-acyl-sn-glycerol-3-phosphate acyltransferase
LDRSSLKILRIIYRLICLVTINFAFVLIGFALNLFFSKDSKKLRRYIAKYSQKWARCVCASLNIEITIQGEIPKFDNALIVANHVGSPDIFVLGSCFQVVFVSKEEVRNWPLIGFLANLGHTIFVNRTRKQQVRETILSIKDRLNSGFSVLLFPEARVTDGNDVYPFKSAHFEAAILSGKPVLPVMIHYENSENPKIARWGNQTFIFHIIALFKNPKLKATVTIFPLIPASSDRKDLSIKSHELIQKSYNEIIDKNSNN